MESMHHSCLVHGVYANDTLPNGAVILPQGLCKGDIVALGDCGLYGRALDDYIPKVVNPPVRQPDNTFVCCVWEGCIRMVLFVTSKICLPDGTEKECFGRNLGRTETVCIVGTANFGDPIYQDITSPVAQTYNTSGTGMLIGFSLSAATVTNANVEMGTF